MSQASPNYPPQPIVIYQSGAGFWKLAAVFGWVGLFIAGLIVIGQWSALAEYFDVTNGLEEKYVSGGKFSSDKIAVISIEGVIMEGDGFVKQQIDRVREDKDVKAIIVRVDSPGGTVTGSDYIYHHLKRLREDKGKIPLVVSMGSMAASGGYYVSMAVDDQENVIFAEPTTTTGSIGVIIPHYDLTGLLDKLDVKDDSIASHERKQMLSMTKHISPEHRELIQAYVDESFGRFKNIVKSGRPIFQKDESALDQLATGEIFSADQAVKHGLVDKIGFLEDAVARALELAKLEKDSVRVVKYKRPASLFDIGAMAKAQQGSANISALTGLLEMSTPRAYYLFSAFPTLAASKRAE
ncbi:Putative signal peptide peptidase SppA [Anatilimnocola aggregata]|uniref:Signal peptide peptidase SppA n=1 Tax=Anatilimnocola aggregata TaxID=2528021 RepID=A0A517Y4Z0_9BACT|nr:signal peptide peptidase SppA [Anatilimnocola aggregata]QDU25192.1 Putative signal peptide peptidase SppA [Anatilimnocola aggregata]